eukprot:gene314-biopygen8545
MCRADSAVRAVWHAVWRWLGHRTPPCGLPPIAHFIWLRREVPFCERCGVAAAGGRAGGSTVCQATPAIRYSHSAARITFSIRSRSTAGAASACINSDRTFASWHLLHQLLVWNWRLLHKRSNRQGEFAQPCHRERMNH